jgi:hypothetical protein
LAFQKSTEILYKKNKEKYRTGMKEGDSFNVAVEPKS